MAPKRKSDGDDAGAAKKAKAKAPLPEFNPAWKAIKPSMLCLGDDLAPSTKVAALDFDQTLIEAKVGSAPFSTEPDSWEWWSASVKDKLKVLRPYTQPSLLLHTVLGKRRCVGRRIQRIVTPAATAAQPERADSFPV